MTIWWIWGLFFTKHFSVLVTVAIHSISWFNSSSFSAREPMVETFALLMFHMPSFLEINLGKFEHIYIYFHAPSKYWVKFSFPYKLAMYIFITPTFSSTLPPLIKNDRPLVSEYQNKKWPISEYRKPIALFPPIKGKWLFRRFHSSNYHSVLL